jgi:hypothetical protein
VTRILGLVIESTRGNASQKEVPMTKSLSARQSIEAAFDGSTSKKLKAAEIIAHVEGNRKSKIGKGTVRTQLQVQSTKGVWIKRVAPGTYQLVKNAPAETARASAPKANDEVTPDPKPASRGRKAEAVPA